MKLLHHVKRHWKAITLHLKKHHKKYIFWILSATLLWKWIGLIATYAVIHHLSFSFADIIWWWDNNTVIETEIKKNNTENESINTDEELNQNQNENTNKNEEETEIEEDNTENENTNEEIVIEENLTDEEEFVEKELVDEEEFVDEEESENVESNDTGEENENTQDTETITEENDEKLWNWICDRWNINITNPKQWDITWKTFNVSREFTNNDCVNNSYIIKLRDQNDQYLNIFSGNANTTEFYFDSTQLMTWFYNITGINELWGEIITYTGQYEWIGTNYYSWYKLAIVSDEWETIYRNENWWEFTIDNKTPEISNIKIEYSTKKNKVNIWDTITISFESDEKLKNSTVNILWQYALLQENNWNQYIYSMDFTEQNTLWKIVYWIEFEDMIWNTGYIEWYEDRELDYTKPTISNLSFTAIWNWKIKITFDTNKKTDANLIYQISNTNITTSIDSTWTDQHKITIEDIKNIYKYNYSISIQDEARNSIYIWWDFYISWDNIKFTKKEITKSEVLTNVGFTWNKEIQNIFNNNFRTCAKEIDTKELKLLINGYKNVTVNIPEFKNSSIRKLTNAFVVVLFERIENKKLPQNVLDEITEDLNNFLIIVKLVKDDNNECKQNMTQYYINRFKNKLERFWLVNH